MAIWARKTGPFRSYSRQSKLQTSQMGHVGLHRAAHLTVSTCHMVEGKPACQQPAHRLARGACHNPKHVAHPSPRARLLRQAARLMGLPSPSTPPMAVASTTSAQGPIFRWARKITLPPACITTNFPNLHAQSSPARQADHHMSPACSHARLPPPARR